MPEKAKQEKTNAMPNNLEAEQSLLGCMIIDNEILSEVLEQLETDDFYQESHQYILSAMKMNFSERKPIDIVTLCDRLDSDGNLNRAGGVTYLSELAQSMPSAANYRHYFDIVKRDGINRKLIRAAGEIAKFARSSDDSVGSIQFAEGKIYDVSRTVDTSTMKDIREGSGIDAVLEKFERLARDKDAYRGLITGFTRLDKLTNGLQRSDLIVIAARPGMGKTSLAMNIVEAAAIGGDAVCAVFSLEMPQTQIIQRLICSAANVSMSDALAGKLEPNDWKKIVKASDKLRKSKINIDDSSRVTPAEILSKCRRIKSKNNGRLDLVMIDYIQLISSGMKNADQNRTQEVAQITRELKIMAKELDVPVIALSQLRRIQSSEPQLSDLRESGAIEQDADIVMFINRPDVNASDEEIVKKNIVKGMADLIIAKHRNGGLDRIKLRFKGELTKFVNPGNLDGVEAPPEEQENVYYDADDTYDDVPPVSDDDVPPDDELPY